MNLDPRHFTQYILPRSIDLFGRSKRIVDSTMLCANLMMNSPCKLCIVVALKFKRLSGAQVRLKLWGKREREDSL